MTDLLIGCGSSRTMQLSVNGRTEWDNLVTVDINPAHKPDVVHDLNVVPWPFADDTFDEVHAYEVLEHLGRQGDAKSFFETFGELWRILKPSGLVVATVPAWDALWAWGDPSHTRIINEGTLAFLDQERYEAVGKTPMSDFRYIWKKDFIAVAGERKDDSLSFVLRAIKPSRLVEGDRPPVQLGLFPLT